MEVDKLKTKTNQDVQLVLQHCPHLDLLYQSENMTSKSLTLEKQLAI